MKFSPCGRRRFGRARKGGRHKARQPGQLGSSSFCQISNFFMQISFANISQNIKESEGFRNSFYYNHPIKSQGVNLEDSRR
jgi:hypothetical protein